MNKHILQSMRTSFAKYSHLSISRTALSRFSLSLSRTHSPFSPSLSPFSSSPSEPSPNDIYHSISRISPFESASRPNFSKLKTHKKSTTDMNTNTNTNSDNTKLSPNNSDVKSNLNTTNIESKSNNIDAQTASHTTANINNSDHPSIPSITRSALSSKQKEDQAQNRAILDRYLKKQLSGERVAFREKAIKVSVVSQTSNKMLTFVVIMISSAFVLIQLWNFYFDREYYDFLMPIWVRQLQQMISNLIHKMA
jgi:hypothetical protein